MIYIAICDDDRPLTGLVEQLLRRIAAEHGISVSCWQVRAERQMLIGML